MFSGKSEELLRRVRRALIAKKKVQVFKSHLDDRYGGVFTVSSHDGHHADAHPISSSVQIAEAVQPGVDVVAIDEAQFLDDGVVKVLDFGLAKAWEIEHGDSSLSMSPTITAAMTQMGVILGTAAYMSPEQARGTEVDKRADIWAYGVILVEMLGGKRLFAGETVTPILPMGRSCMPGFSVSSIQVSPPFSDL